MEENEEDNDHKTDILEQDCKDIITKNTNRNKIEDIALDDKDIVKLKNDKIGDQKTDNYDICYY